MNETARSLNRIISKFEHTRLSQIDDLKRVAAIVGECGSEHEALRTAMNEFMTMGEQEWINAKAMTTNKAKMYCVQRSRTWYNAAECLKRKITDAV